MPDLINATINDSNSFNFGFGDKSHKPKDMIESHWHPQEQNAGASEQEEIPNKAGSHLIYTPHKMSEFLSVVKNLNLTLGEEQETFTIIQYLDDLKWVTTLLYLEVKREA
jgi:hypothetical protein